MIQLSEALRARPVVAVLRAPDADRFIEVSSVLIEAGIPAVEFTLTSAGVFDALRRARDELPAGVLVGAGSVRTVEQAHRAIDAGASFLVSQVTDAAVIEAAHSRDVPFVPGALTPNEIVLAWSYGVQAVKVSPVGPVGGVSYVAELVGPLPDIRLMPTGLVRIDEAGDYLTAGAAFVGVSRDLTRDALLPGGDLAGLAERAARAVRSVDVHAASAA
ncbi:bifunctional 4-hydroxy-2-oxoglutarate aldolase/2-dehydro-3-deoxy-phosphogluconate aldolase [Kribbella sp. NBC_01245]|uniref:bifunctional 4-hydroxy-2-oxoglutarate aldolase/2-dehydro-3-deoxy-phosphogluconate aldolase n=1 Tax=Kribbella sp. NBC_01245 TaxID=2903578 RepID=UPI002E2AC803|nr:bifunctional 4-hydroxy-2-oxoglutarate aldolase/2-dehydro-3-deoxy-phosphogluconate aldolase [Kribbella sp. NBC_01245]